MAMDRGGASGAAGGGKSGGSSTKLTYNERLAVDSKKKALSDRIAGMGQRFAGMGFEQRMSMAQSMVGSAGLDSSDYGLVSRIAGEIERAGEAYTREQDRKQQEREQALLKHAQAADRKSSSRSSTAKRTVSAPRP